MTTVVLYSRPGCCLCDEARMALQRAQARHRFELQERDIEQDEALMRAYLERIPVVTINGAEEFALIVGDAELERALCRVEME